MNESRLGAQSRMSVFAARRESKEMPPHLRIVEVDFLKPGVRNPSGRKVELDELPSHDGMWE